MEVLKVNDPLRVVLVKLLRFHFSVIYTWSFNTEKKRESLRIFALLVKDFVKLWRQLFRRGKNRNYYHWLAVEALKASWSSLLLV